MEINCFADTVLTCQSTQVLCSFIHTLRKPLQTGLLAHSQVPGSSVGCTAVISIAVPVASGSRAGTVRRAASC